MTSIYLPSPRSIFLWTLSRVHLPSRSFEFKPQTQEKFISRAHAIKFNYTKYIIEINSFKMSQKASKSSGKAKSRTGNKNCLKFELKIEK